MTAAPFSFDNLPPDRDARYATAQCKVRIARPTPHLIVTRIEGYFSSDACAFFDATFRRMASDGVRYDVFHDWWEVTDYVPEARVKLTALGRDLERINENVHILVRSKLVAFGVKIASVMLRNIKPHSDRETFDPALAQALRLDATPTRM